MNIQEYNQPHKLERYSFLWSEVRLLVAALALFLGGYPPVMYFLGTPALYGILTVLLKLSWIISGVASAYMIYRWNGNGKMLFGNKNSKDTYAFFVSVISGINLGITGLLQVNIGMSITRSDAIFLLVGIVYIVSSVYLFKRWKANGEKIF